MPGELDLDIFFADYWQQRPLYIPQFLPNCDKLIEAEELAGLACEEEIESRLVFSDENWRLQHGPFQESDFLQLPARGWSLLVQSVNHQVPEIHALYDYFRFLPQWRFDDIMASYTPGGGCSGPHFDYYDVFILQATGQREWQLGEHCGPHSTLRHDCDLCLLENFSATETYILQPGDLLYIPQQLAHWGKGDAESLSYSIGFRSPSDAELLAVISDHIGNELGEHQRLQENGPQPTTANGAIDAATLAQLRTRLHTLIDDCDLNTVFGEYVSSLAHPEGLPELDDDLKINDRIELQALLDDLQTQQQPLLKDESARLLYLAESDGNTRLFCNGQRCEPTVTAALAQLLCDHHAVSPSQLQPFLLDSGAVELLIWLLNHGIFYWHE